MFMMVPKKVLVVGDWRWPWYQEACSRALETLGHKVVRFGWADRLAISTGSGGPSLRGRWLQIQARLQFGPTIWRIRRDLIELAAKEQPDVIFFYNVQMIDPETVFALRRSLPDTVFCQYANDDPFSVKAAPGLWRNFVKSIHCFDLHFAYRPANIVDFRQAGARDVHLLRAYFIPEEDYPVARNDCRPSFRSDVVFAGHYENDGRLDGLLAAASTGLRVTLFGSGWDRPLAAQGQAGTLRNLAPVVPVFGAEYREAICGANVALCFLSTLNRDGYTRRNFQIPAMEVAMLTQRSSELEGMFVENRETAFFRSPDELLKRLTWLIDHEPERKAMAIAGRMRVHNDGHDVVSRMGEMMMVVQEFMNRR